MTGTPERRRAIEAATRVYLAGGSLDMSALAHELGIGRATLYRHAGNRDQLLATVLAEATARTYRKARAAATDVGPAGILDTLERMMHAVDDSQPLRVLTQREPTLFIRLALMPGPIEETTAACLAATLEEEAAAGQLELPLPSAALAKAIVRICDVHLYASLLGGERPEIDTALDLVALLLGASRDHR